MNHTAIPPTGLLCELLEHPERTQVTNPRPCFGWIFNDAARDTHQAGFQILVASTRALLDRDKGDMWDSGEPQPAKAWTTDSRSLHLPYAGKPLASKHSPLSYRMRGRFVLLFGVRVKEHGPVCTHIMG